MGDPQGRGHIRCRSPRKFNQEKPVPDKRSARTKTATVSELLIAQAANPVAARYFAAQRLFGVMFLILLVVSIIYVIKRIAK
jgi:hypothetical protein